MMPLSHVLRKCTGEYKLHKSQEKINHLMYIDNIRLFAKNEKELETLIQAVRIYCQDIRMEFGTEKCTQLIIRSRKRQMTGGIELTKSRKKQNAWGKGNLRVLENIGSGHHQTSKYERKKFKSVSLENEKTTRNQTIYQKPHQRDKYLGCLSL